MLPVVPFDIIELIIDIIGESKDTDLLKELALVSHLFLSICRKHLFAAVDLYDIGPKRNTSSKQGFIKLVKNNPDIVKYIRKLTYDLSRSGDRLLESPVLPNFLRTIPQLEYLAITSAWSPDWNKQDSSLKSALLFLMALPTTNHIELVYIENFPFSALTTCLNLNRLRISSVGFTPLDGDSRPESIHLKNFRGLKQLSMDIDNFEDYQNARYLLQNSKHLDALRMEDFYDEIHTLSGLLYPSTRSLRFLYLRVPLGDELPIPLAGLCEELEAIAGHNVLEALEFRVDVDGHETENTIGFIIQQLEEVLVKPEWSTLKQVTLEISIACCSVRRQLSEQLRDALQSLPKKYLKRLSSLQTFDYSAYIMDCLV